MLSLVLIMQLIIIIGLFTVLRSQGFEIIDIDAKLR